MLDACQIQFQTAVARKVLACGIPKWWHGGGGWILKWHIHYPIELHAHVHCSVIGKGWMQEMRDSEMEGFGKGGIWERRDLGKEGVGKWGIWERKGGIREWRDAGKKEFRRGRMQERRDTEPEGFGKGGIWEIRNSGKGKTLTWFTILALTFCFCQLTLPIHHPRWSSKLYTSSPYQGLERSDDINSADFPGSSFQWIFSFFHWVIFLLHGKLISLYFSERTWIWIIEFSTVWINSTRGKLLPDSLFSL